MGIAAIRIGVDVPGVAVRVPDRHLGFPTPPTPCSASAAAVPSLTGPSLAHWVQGPPAPRSSTDAIARCRKGALEVGGWQSSIED
jgi:hypothetical protein